LQEVESEGLQLVREGRAARLAAVQQHMTDGSSNRDQQLAEARGSSDYGGSGGLAGYSSSGGRASLGRLSPGRNALRGIGGRDGRGSSLAGSTSSMGGAERMSSGGGADWRPAGRHNLYTCAATAGMHAQHLTSTFRHMARFSCCKLPTSIRCKLLV
jgi:hypothetical protein